MRLNLRVPEQLCADIETIYESSPSTFNSLSDCAVRLLQEAVAVHLPETVAVNRQAATGGGVNQREGWVDSDDEITDEELHLLRRRREAQAEAETEAKDRERARGGKRRAS